MDIIDHNTLQFIVLTLIIVSGFFSVYFKNLLSAIIAVSALSLLISLEFYILQAPDVAISQAAIGACLTTAVFLITLKKINWKSRGELDE